MKYCYNFNILTIALYFLTNAQCTSDLVKNYISEMYTQIPKLKQEINTAITTSSLKSVQLVLNKGMTDFTQNANMIKFSKVKDSNITKFATYLAKLVAIPNNHSNDFEDSLMSTLYSDTSKIVIFKYLYSINDGGESKFIVILSQRNEDTNTSEFIIGEINSTFLLAPDVFYITKTSSSFLSIIQTETVWPLKIPKNIEKEEIELIFKFFEVCVFERFHDLLILDRTSNNLNFLES